MLLIPHGLEGKLGNLLNVKLRGIYGFTRMYSYTKDQKYLEASLNLLEYYFSRLPFNHYVPKWDFSQPGTGLDLTKQDTSAAMIIASALSDLGKLTMNPIFRKLSLNTYQYLFDQSQDYIPVGLELAGILQHGTSNAPRGQTDHALVYGDFYLLEGLLKL
jgi:unsaturated chondroitin disaccharide hydrolase